MSSPTSFGPPTGTKNQPAPVLRHGDTVLRPAGPWTPAVHALLGHLESVGFTGSPRVVGDGHDGHGREVLTYIDGDFVHPHAWSDEGIRQVGRLLRDLHDATATFRPPRDAEWHPWPFHSGAPGAIIGHRDTGPWNIVARDGLPVAFIDWPTAGPIDRLDEIAATGWLNAQLHDDDVAERQNLPGAATRAAQLRHFLDGYGLPAGDRRHLVTRMIEYAVRDCAAEAVTARITPESTDPEPLWALAWRARSAAWMLRHRNLLENAIAP
ncbi:aminoglycoside phosphotransferase family protein [Actinomadura sp. 21ATH]|uniref:aminoglycoside phosphotransferase family protein n=1 Tax=Actinomadura sp. 21ATH TaxID=1735444 RepID=UPI0035BF4EED